MARLQNDTAAAERYEKILETAKANQDKALFDGEYFIQVPDPVPREDYLTGCYIDQMLGQWWALQVNLGWLYPPGHVRKAMESLFRYNFHTDFHGFRQSPRRFCEDGDAGMNMGTWPKGGRPKSPHIIRYTEEIMSGFEYTAACLMIECGLLCEGFTVLHAAADRYDGRLRHLPGWTNNASWGYSGNPFGDDECGKFYARAMSIWGVLVASQGFAYDAATASIGFAPIWKPEDHVSFFTAAEGWGTFSQKLDGESHSAEIELKWGSLKLKTVALETSHATSVKLTHAGKQLAAQLRRDGHRAVIALEEPVELAAGQKLEITLS